MRYSNAAALRGRYDRLTPFERACVLVRKAVGGKRTIRKGDALEASTPAAAYWVKHWGDAVLLTAGMAYYRAAFALSRGEETEAAAWLEALGRLETETGAPFRACAGMYGPKVEAPEGRPSPVACLGPYVLLRGVWDANCEDVNPEDAGRRLPPPRLPEWIREGMRRGGGRRKRRRHDSAAVGEGPAEKAPLQDRF